jgi:undecaprenyl diphosphate synthase
VQACRQALALGLQPEEVTEESFARLLTLSDVPDPDLFIRTGGEMRLSNFLLWQAAYAELYFTDCLWPDFGVEQIDLALASYAARDRRFGGAESWSHGPDAPG